MLTRKGSDTGEKEGNDRNRIENHESNDARVDGYHLINHEAFVEFEKEMQSIHEWAKNETKTKIEPQMIAIQQYLDRCETNVGKMNDKYTQDQQQIKEMYQSFLEQMLKEFQSDTKQD